jgi:transposase
MADAQIPECSNCRRLIGLIEQLHISYGKRIAELEARIARLERNSSNSHRPPSSDIVKPKPPAGKVEKKRSIGGQPGHPRHERKPFPPEQIDRTQEYRLEHCPDCGGSLQEAPPEKSAPRVLQQVELPEKPVIVTEHRAPAYWCPHCQKVHYARLSAGVESAGLVGPRLSALVAWLKAQGHASYSTIQQFLGDVLGLKVSRGHLVNLVGKAAAALDAPYEELRAALCVQPRLNVDETGNKEGPNKSWTWCLRAPFFTVYRIVRSRGSKVLVEMLGTVFKGVLCCDYFSAYRKYMRQNGVQVQFCMAHLVREARFLAEHTGPTGSYGEEMVERLRALFHLYHRSDSMPQQALQAALERERRKLLRAATHPPDTRLARNMAQRFLEHAESYFRFTEAPALEPTNNLAEQALRHVVIDRRITQGTRGIVGSLRCERLWTARATCHQQGRSVFEYFCCALHAHLAGQPPPSLLAA